MKAQSKRTNLPYRKEFYNKFIQPPTEANTSNTNNGNTLSQYSNQNTKFIFPSILLDSSGQNQPNQSNQPNTLDILRRKKPKKDDLLDIDEINNSISNSINEPKFNQNQSQNQKKQNINNNNYLNNNNLNDIQNDDRINLIDGPIKMNNFNNILKSDESFKGKRIIDDNLQDKIKGQKNTRNINTYKVEENKLKDNLEEIDPNIFNKKIFNKHRGKNKNYEESKGEEYEIKIYPKENSKNNIFSSDYENSELSQSQYQIEQELITESDGLTPLPEKRKSDVMTNPINYNQAKSAAIFIRRIEYSYNLKLTTQYKKWVKQIIFIQRYWRNYQKEKQRKLMIQKLLKEQRRIEKRKAFKKLMNIVSKIYYRKRIKEYFEIIKNNFAHLYFSKIANKAVKKIIDAWNKYKQRKKEKMINTLKMRFFFDSKKLFFIRFHRLLEVLHKIVFLQRYIKMYLKMNSENFFLDCGRNYHPFLYYLSKYRSQNCKAVAKNNKNKNMNYKDIQQKKILNFISYVKRWKQFHQNIKDERVRKFVHILHVIFYRELFNIFMTNLIKMINAEITYILLKPRINSLLYLYFRNSTFEKFKIWKYQTRKSKSYIITGKNLIKKLMHIYGFKPAIKKIKNFIYKKDKSFAICDILKNFRYIRLLSAMEKLKFNYVTEKNKNNIVKNALLKHLVYRNSLYTKFHYYYLYKEKVLQINQNKNRILLLLFKKNQFRYKLLLNKFLFQWKKMLLVYNNYETMSLIFLRVLSRVIKNNSNKFALKTIRIDYYKKIALDKIENMLIKQDKKIILNLNSKFYQWQKTSKLLDVNMASTLIGQCYKKKVIHSSFKKKNAFIFKIIKIQSKFRQYKAKKTVREILSQ